MIIMTPRENPTKHSKMKLCVNPFVCVDDIVRHPVSMNHVVYNPHICDKKRVREMLYDNVSSLFEYKLSDDELDALCSFDTYHTSEFTEALRNILNDD